MSPLIVTAKKLNKRKRIPHNFPDPASIIGEVFKGSTFEGVEVEESEILNKDLGKWYKDRDGHFYWGGGVEKSAGQINYQTQFATLPAQWLQTRGKNIKVAVLDTGFFLEHVDLMHLKSTAVIQDFGENNNTNDKQGHGTHVLGLLGARSEDNGVTGLIPDAEFFLYKVIQDDVGFLDFFVEAAILDAVKKEVDIISMSFNVPAMENSSLHNAIKKAVENNIVIVASAGENDNLIQSSLVAPAKFEGVISVGEASPEFSQALRAPFNDQLDFIMPFVFQKSCWINQSTGMYHELKGSSMATALIAGILASIMSFNKKETNALNELKNIAEVFSSTVFNDLALKVIKPKSLT